MVEIFQAKIFITGTPGIGKSTYAEQLRRERYPDGHIVHLDAFLNKGDHITPLSIAKALTSSGSTVIAEGVMANYRDWIRYSRWTEVIYLTSKDPQATADRASERDQNLKRKSKIDYDTYLEWATDWLRRVEEFKDVSVLRVKYV